VLASTWLHADRAGHRRAVHDSGRILERCGRRRQYHAVNPGRWVKWWLEARQGAYGAWGLRVRWRRARCGIGRGWLRPRSGWCGQAPCGAAGLAQGHSADAGCSCDLGARSQAGIRPCVDTRSRALASCCAMTPETIPVILESSHAEFTTTNRSRAPRLGTVGRACEATVRRDGQAGHA